MQHYSLRPYLYALAPLAVTFAGSATAFIVQAVNNDAAFPQGPAVASIVSAAGVGFVHWLQLHTVANDPDTKPVGAPAPVIVAPEQADPTSTAAPAVAQPTATPPQA